MVITMLLAYQLIKFFYGSVIKQPFNVVKSHFVKSSHKCKSKVVYFSHSL